MKKALLPLGMGLIMLMAGCSSTHRPTGYLASEPNLLKGRYFEREYIAENADFSGYEKVQIERMTLNYFYGRHRYTHAEVARLRFKFRKALERKLGQHFWVLNTKEKPDGKTLVISPEITHIQTPNVVGNAVTKVLFFIPAAKRGGAAFEMKISDGETGELLAELAEKRTGGSNVKSLAYGAYTKFTHAESAFEHWADQLHLMLTNPEYPMWR